MKKSNSLYFFTATILEWKYLLKKDKYKEVITQSLKYLQSKEKIKYSSAKFYNEGVDEFGFLETYMNA